MEQACGRRVDMSHPVVYLSVCHFQTERQETGRDMRHTETDRQTDRREGERDRQRDRRQGETDRHRDRRQGETSATMTVNCTAAPPGTKSASRCLSLPLSLSLFIYLSLPLSLTHTHTHTHTHCPYLTHPHWHNHSQIDRSMKIDRYK